MLNVYFYVHVLISLVFYFRYMTQNYK